MERICALPYTLRNVADEFRYRMNSVTDTTWQVSRQTPIFAL